MTTEVHIQRMERKLRGIAKVRDEMDVFGLTVEGERRLATRMQQTEELRREHEQRMREIDEKLNALIGIVDGFIRGKG
jgi:hypothetical protein